MKYFTLVIGALFVLTSMMACDRTDGEGETQVETVGEQGGVVESLDGRASIEFGQGAVEGQAQVSIQRQADPGHGDLRTEIYQLGIDQDLQQPVTLSIRLRDGASEDGVVLARWDGDEAHPVADSSAEAGVVTGSLEGFSSYGGFALQGSGESSDSIGIDGGAATSSDGNLKIEFPAGAVLEENFPEWWEDDHAVEVEISNFSQELGEYSETAGDERFSDSYTITAVPQDVIENLGEPVTLNFEMGEAIGDRAAFVVAGGAGVHGVLATSESQGTTVTAKLSDLSKGPFAAIVYDSTERCESADPVGKTCSDDDDCRPADGELTCVCEEGETGASSRCHEGQCTSAAALCAGVGAAGMIGTGHCQDFEDHGPWTGDCY